MRLDDFWNYVDRTSDGCWEWQRSRSNHGHGRVRIGNRERWAHRIAWELTYGPIPDDGSYHGICVCHRCDNPPCCRPDHLFLGTHRENMHDALRKGRIGKKAPVHDTSPAPTAA